jgi:hypothetical protein
MGVLARGGIAQGNAYHSDRVLFGSAIIDAYDLEQNAAKFVRIAVSQQVAQQWAEAFGMPGGLVAYKDMIRQDSDGTHFLDIFHFPLSDSIDRGTEDFFRKAGPLLSKMLSDSNLGERERAKMRWMAEQYNGSSIVKSLGINAVGL